MTKLYPYAPFDLSDPDGKVFLTCPECDWMREVFTPKGGFVAFAKHYDADHDTEVSN